jgi:hypothetical protein
VLEDYIKVFLDGTREDLHAYVHLPVVYLSEDGAQLRERYPFDPVKLREVTGLAHSQADIDVIHADNTKAHVVMNVVRKRADGSPLEGVQALYILQDRGDGWKIAAFSGIRSPAE